VITIQYSEFKEYHDNNPNLDNIEYYEKFPDTNKSTIRSWKSRAAHIEVVEEPTENQAKQSEGYEELEAEFIKVLMVQTSSNESELKGLDNKSKLLILKNRKAAQEKENKNKNQNSGILPSPKPIGQGKKRFGLDDYIVFDDKKGEIRMQIPMNVLLDPKRNKALGLIK